MSRPMADTPKRRRPRRQFDDDFEAPAVRLVLDDGKSVARERLGERSRARLSLL